MSIPVFFVHKSNSPYLKYALKQARKYNPDSKIYLLGDDSNNCFDFVSHHKLSDYSKSADEFAKIYLHMSATDIEYELFCFLRWLYIKDFVIEHSINSFIYFDSDVLIFSDIEKALRPYAHFDIANTGDYMPAVTYFKDKSAIIDFCEFMAKQYTDAKYFEGLKSEWEAQKPRNWGGICDMVIFLYYFRDFPENKGKLDKVIDHSCFDGHIRVSNRFEVNNGMKMLFWKNNEPYGKRISDNKIVKFHCLHYHGESKALMYKHYNAGGYYWSRIVEYFNELRNRYQLRTRIRSIFNK